MPCAACACAPAGSGAYGMEVDAALSGGTFVIQGFTGGGDVATFLGNADVLSGPAGGALALPNSAAFLGGSCTSPQGGGTS